MASAWTLTVLGDPVGQGSMSAVGRTKTVIGEDGKKKKVPVTHENGQPVIHVFHGNEEKLQPWRQSVGMMARAKWRSSPLLTGPVAVNLEFYVKRPAYHFGTGRNAGVIKDSAPLYPVTTGHDLDKLERAVLDALTGTVFLDDKLVIKIQSKRLYGTPARLELKLRVPRVRTVGELRELMGVEPEIAESIANQLSLELVA